VEELRGSRGREAEADRRRRQRRQRRVGGWVERRNVGSASKRSDLVAKVAKTAKAGEGSAGRVHERDGRTQRDAPTSSADPRCSKG